MSVDPTLASALALILETSANKALRYDPGTRAKLNKLGDKNGNPLLKLECTEPELNLYFVLTENSFCVKAINDDDSQPSSTIVRGKLLDLINLLLKEEISLSGTGVDIRGKVQTLASFKDALSDLDIDWEQAIVEKTGAVAGHQIAQALRAFGSWGLIQQEVAKTTLSDTLIHELRLVPSEHELSAYADGIDNLRSATDRLAARINALRINVANSINTTK